MTPSGSRDVAVSATASSASATPEGTDGTTESNDATNGGGAMGSSPVAAAGTSTGMKKGPWTAAEDAILIEYVREHGVGNWNAVQKSTGLLRCGKSCRLRWANHLRPNLKKGSFSPEEERLILELHAKMGNKWAHMAGQMPGRTDNEIKNYWNTRLKQRQRAGLPLYPPDIQRQAALHHRPPNSGPASPSFFDHKPQLYTPVGATHLPQVDPINFPAVGTMIATTPLLLGHPQPFLAPPATAASHHQGVKRLRDDDMSFPLPFSSNPVPPSPSQSCLLHFNPLGNYDLGPPPPPPPLSQEQSFSVTMELPSSQLYSQPPAAGGDSGILGLPLERGNSELLDALLRDTQPEGSSNNGRNGNGGDHLPRDFLSPEALPEDVKWIKESVAEVHPTGKWDDSNRPIDAKMKTQPVGDDLSGLLDVIPMAGIPAAAQAVSAAPREWYASDSGELSNGQSSAVTDDVGLEMQPLVSSLSAAPEEDNSWGGIAPCHWGGTPGIR